MATPIKETPILRGKDAIRFEQKMKKRCKVCSEDLARIKSNYKKFKTLFKIKED